MNSSVTENSQVTRHLRYAMLALVVILLIGTIGYRVLGGEKYSWVDCFYMTFITISTIGYTEAVDVTQYEYGRLFTVFVGFTGIGTLGYVVSTVTAFILESDLNVALRRKKMREKIEKLEDHYIVCGSGRVGSNVVHELEVTGRPCVVIDSDMASINKYLESHPAQLYLHGNATDDDVLLNAGLMRARGVFAVAHDDNDNLVISLSVKQLNPRLRVVARCHDLKNADKINRAGADEIVSPDFTGGLRLVSAMLSPMVVNFLDDMLKSEDSLRMEEIILPDSLDNKQLNTLYLGNRDFVVLAIRQQPRGKWAFNPNPQHIMRGGDVLMVMATPEGRIQLEQMVQDLS
jgi:voltage-gated potassium channel